MKKNLPTGENFLPDISIDELKRRYKKETNSKARERLLAYIARKKGHSLRTIGSDLCRTHGTIRSWILRADNGLDRLYDIKRLGPARRLTSEQLAELKEDLIAGPQTHGFETNLWTGKIVAKHILNKHGIRYVPRTMQQLMHELGFRHKKPRPRHPKAASEEEKTEFKKKLQSLPHTTMV